MSERIRVGVVGGTGYTGVELLRLLTMHPFVNVTTITSRAEQGVRADSLFPSLRGYCDLEFTDPEQSPLNECDAVFFATPHAVAMNTAGSLVEAGVKVIDLSADFRLRDIPTWEQWYAHPHTAPGLVAEAVYGLPELNRNAIPLAQLVAVPGCYPTAVQLGFAPLVEAGLVDPAHLIASCASGVSGAGRQGKIDNLLTEAGDSFKAYGVSGHRHLPEIEQGLNALANMPVSLTFVPHLTPMSRGIHATLFATLTAPGQDLQQLFEQRYADEPFVDVLPAGLLPQTRSVRGSNICRIAVHRPQGRDTVVVTSVIDNLVKGASGQAIQNLNLLFGWPETTGLITAPPLSP